MPFSYGLLYEDRIIDIARFWHSQIVVDFGCGKLPDSYVIAKIAGARAYIGVDPYNIPAFYRNLADSRGVGGDDNLNNYLSLLAQDLNVAKKHKRLTEKIMRNIEAHIKGSKIPVASVAEDMVSALRRFPDNSISVLTSGMDHCILWDSEYVKLAEREITRVLHTDGAYFSFYSRLTPENLRLDTPIGSRVFKKFIK